MKIDKSNLNQSQLTMDQFGRRLAARLDVSAQNLSHDIGERLRVARMQAIAAKRAPAWETATAANIQIQGNLASLQFDFNDGNLWNKFASFLPIAALVIGVFVVFNFQDNQITSELAEVDAKLLLDDLPPTAYTDPGFLKFLQTTNDFSTDSARQDSSDTNSDQTTDSSSK